MKHRSIPLTVLAILAGVSIVSPAFAMVTIDYVTVGNANNAADTTGYGSVGYTYQIGKYEVTNAQYIEFLNAADPGGSNPNGIYNTNMGTDARGGITFTSGAASGSKYTIRSSMGDKPVNYVSWYDAARFTNWLQNGQGSASTETGAYTLSGNIGIITKNAGATVWLPTEDEWYKAAYYDPAKNAGAGGYWLYPTQSDTVPTVAAAGVTGDVSNPGINVANYNQGADWNGQDGNVTTVGSGGGGNFYGTADQGGNVWEWNDAVISGAERGRRGGSWNYVGDNFFTDYLQSSGRSSGDPSNETSNGVGFRVTSVPEPSSMVLAIFASAALMTRRQRGRFMPVAGTASRTALWQVPADNMEG